MNRVRRSCSLVFAGVLLYCAVATAQSTGLQEALTQQYVDSILVLRHSLQKGAHEYDSSGKLQNPGTEGPWTLYGRILVEKITVSADKLQVEGKRVRCAFDPRRGQMAPLAYEGRVKVQVHLAKAPASLEEANAILQRVFALTKADLLESVPEAWRDYAAGTADAEVNLSLDPPAGSAKQASAQSATAHSPASSEKTMESEQVYKLVDGIRPPKGKSTPAAPFPPDLSRDEQLSGSVVLETIIDSSGHTRPVRILRPLGLGFDEIALKTVSGWTFEPAEKDGKPVAVVLAVEVPFRPN